MPPAIDVGEELNHGLTRSQWSSRVKKGYVEKFLRLPGEREEAALAEMPSAPAVARVSDAAAAALKAEFGKVHDGIRLLATMQVGLANDEL